MTNAVKLFNCVVATIQAALDAEFVLTAKVVMAECLRDALVVSVLVVVVVSVCVEGCMCGLLTHCCCCCPSDLA